jgi:hypothetical protein
MSDEQTLQPVTFGSVIYLSTEMNLNSYMFSDGFMDNRVILKEYDGICGEAKVQTYFVPTRATTISVSVSSWCCRSQIRLALMCRNVWSLSGGTNCLKMQGSKVPFLIDQ